MHDLLIRQAQIEDIRVLADLAVRSVLGLSAGFYDPAQSVSAANCITVPDIDLISDGTLFVAVWDGQIVGCGAWSKRKKLYTGSDPEANSHQWLDPAVEPARIRAFFVDPEFSRRSIARRLFGACKDQAEAEGFNRFELMATLPGVPFYLRLGFEPHESVQLDLVDGTKLPAIRMTAQF